MALNTVNMMGRLTADPELRTTDNNTKVCSFRIAVPKPVKKNSENARELTNFFSCTAWNQNAENIVNYFKKGQRIIITGTLQNRDFVNKEGINVTVTEIIVDRFEFVEPRSDGAAPVVTAPHRAEAPTTYSVPADSVESRANDQLPF